MIKLSDLPKINRLATERERLRAIVGSNERVTNYIVVCPHGTRLEEGQTIQLLTGQRDAILNAIITAINDDLSSMGVVIDDEDDATAVAAE